MEICKHLHTETISGTGPSDNMDVFYEKRCLDCGKVLEDPTEGLEGWDGNPNNKD